MSVFVDWDPRKAKRNLKNHGVSFGEAATVFDDPLSLTIADPLHSEYEDRFIITGESNKGRLLVVVHVDRGYKVRIISARLAASHERMHYEEGN